MPSSEASLPWGGRLDAIAQQRFNRTDWIELAATILLSLATIAAAWSAYQATRWGGVQANSFSASGHMATTFTVSSHFCFSTSFWNSSGFDLARLSFSLK